MRSALNRLGGDRLAARLPEAAAFGRVLDQRSVGVHDLVAGLPHEVTPLPHERCRLVSATLTPRHPVGAVVGDLLVQVPSAHGRPNGRRAGAEGELFPGVETLHLGGTDQFALLKQPAVHRALRDWLA